MISVWRRYIQIYKWKLKKCRFLTIQVPQASSLDRDSRATIKSLNFSSGSIDTHIYVTLVLILGLWNFFQNCPISVYNDHITEFSIAIVGTLDWYFYTSISLLPETVPKTKSSTKLLGIVQTVHRGGRLGRLMYQLHDSCNIIQTRCQNFLTSRPSSRPLDQYSCVQIHWRFSASLIWGSHKPTNVELVEPRSD